MEASLKLTQKEGNNLLRAKLVSIDDQMTVEGHVDLADFFKNGKNATRPNNEDSFLNNKLFKIPVFDGANISTDFSFHTRMDDITIDKISFSGFMVIPSTQASVPLAKDDK